MGLKYVDVKRQNKEISVNRACGLGTLYKQVIEDALLPKLVLASRGLTATAELFVLTVATGSLFSVTCVVTSKLCLVYHSYHQ